jgi:hypothetical protein
MVCSQIFILAFSAALLPNWSDAVKQSLMKLNVDVKLKKMQRQLPTRRPLHVPRKRNICFKRPE